MRQYWLVEQFSAIRVDERCDSFVSWFSIQERVCCLAASVCGMDQSSLFYFGVVGDVSGSFDTCRQMCDYILTLGCREIVILFCFGSSKEAHTRDFVMFPRLVKLFCLNYILLMDFPTLLLGRPR